MSAAAGAAGDADVFAGFWLPRHMRDDILREAAWEGAYLRGGVLAEEPPPSTTPAGGGDDAGVLIRRPRLTPEQWTTLLARLQAARTLSGAEAAARWQAALQKALGRLAEQMSEMLPVLSASTGYTPDMLMAALAGGDLLESSSLADALDYRPTWSVASNWETIPRAGGRVRFFPERAGGRVKAALGIRSRLFRPAPTVDLTLGYAAGNVPGTALMIALLGSLANHAAPAGTPAPALVVRNSRHEPLFAPWVLSAVETVDPELVAGVAVMIWDYDDPALQTLLFRSAGLLMAAADDGTIAALDGWRARCAPGLRFHRHGHKAGFATLGSSWADQPDAARRAALDSSFWDQNGCLSARVHFVEGDAPEYARTLAEEMRTLAHELPRGTTPGRFTRRAFDAYASLVDSGRVRLLSEYDDDFAVIQDDRAWDAAALRRAVNHCQGRVVVVRPVGDVMEVPGLLRALPPANLQSMSVLLEADRLEAFAWGVGSRGVTALRGLGRGAFPQLAYSWDGLLPTDTCHLRPSGHFATIEPTT